MKTNSTPIVSRVVALMRHCLLIAPIFVAIVLFNSAPQARSAQLQGVTIHSVSSEYTSGADLRRATGIVSDSGFFGDYHTAAPRGAMWLSSPTAAGAFTNAFVTFDLGSVQAVHQMKVWNYNENGTITRRGIQKANISWAAEDLVFTTNLLDQTFTRAPGIFTNNFAQLFDMGGVSARYVRIDVLTNYFEANDNRVGLSKVRFINTNTPPTIDLVTRNLSGNRVTVKFSEPVSPSSATNPANYSIQSGAITATITSVAMDTFNNRVVLETSVLDANLSYTLSAQNVLESTDTISIINTEVAIEPEVVLWLKADAGVTMDPSGFVSQWADQSGAGNHAFETDPTAQPQFVDGVINGKPSLRFDGINDGVVAPHAPSLLAEGDISFFAVVNPHSLAAYNAILSKCSGAASNYPAPFDYHLAPTTGKPRLLRGNGSSLSVLNGTSNTVAGQTYIVEIVVKGTTATHYLNGYFNGTATFADGIEDLGNPVRVGRREDNGLWFTGDIAEVILIRGAVTENERLAIDEYLGRKYAIATPNIGLPTITSQPEEVVTYVGETAAFSVSLTNGAIPRSFQWYQTPDVLLPGETNSTLVISNLTLAQDNTAYYLVVTNLDGSMQSDSAALSVLPLTSPYIEEQPQSQTVYLHQSATFGAVARGSAELSYQWKFGTTDIPGATESTFTVVDADQTKAGNYSLVVSNSFGVTNSEPATLTVLIPETGTYPAAVLAANPLVYYRFADIAETNVTFNFGNIGSSHNGVYEGSYTPGVGPMPPLPFEETNAAYKDETLTAGGVQVPALKLNTNSGPRATIAGWVYQDFVQAAHAGIYFSRMTGQSCGLGADLISGTSMLEYHWNDLYHGFNSGLIIPVSQWTFVAMVVEPTQATLYMNAGGGMQSATNIAAHSVRPVLNPGYVGADPLNNNGTRRWFGSIDELMIFDRALTPEEINALYTGTVVAPPVHLEISISGSEITLSWPNGVLQQADQVDGEYLDMVGITSPHLIAPAGNGKFYRVKVATP